MVVFGYFLVLKLKLQYAVLVASLMKRGGKMKYRAVSSAEKSPFSLYLIKMNTSEHSSTLQQASHNLMAAAFIKMVRSSAHERCGSF